MDSWEIFGHLFSTLFQLKPLDFLLALPSCLEMCHEVMFAHDFEYESLYIKISFKGFYELQFYLRNVVLTPQYSSFFPSYSSPISSLHVSLPLCFSFFLPMFLNLLSQSLTPHYIWGSGKTLENNYLKMTNCIILQPIYY